MKQIPYRSIARHLWRLLRALLIATGVISLCLFALQWTPCPWRAYEHLSNLPNPASAPPTHILLMGGSGIPGKSGLIRTYYAARAAAQYPDAGLVVAMPLDANDSDASAAYLHELRMRGVPPHQMRVMPGGRNTREQAIRLHELLDGEHAAASILIVSDPYHIRRTAACLRKVGLTQLSAMPSHAESIEDPLEWRADELTAAACSASLERHVDSDGDPAGQQPAKSDEPAGVGGSLHLRYSL